MKVNTMLVKTHFVSLILCFSVFSVHAKELRFPNFPASFEVSMYKGSKGCLQNDPRVITAINANEGTKTFATLPIVQTPKDGVHAMVVVYHKDKDYGYNLSDKADGELCVSEKLSHYSWKKAGNFQVLAANKSYSKEECNFTPRYTDTCGSFSRLSGALLSRGFTIDFQAINEKGHIDTFLSGENKAYRLTTHAKTGATVITGNGTSAFVFHTVPVSP